MGLRLTRGLAGIASTAKEQTIAFVFAVMLLSAASHSSLSLSASGRKEKRFRSRRFASSRLKPQVSIFWRSKNRAVQHPGILSRYRNINESCIPEGSQKDGLSASQKSYNFGGFGDPRSSIFPHSETMTFRVPFRIRGSRTIWRLDLP